MGRRSAAVMWVVAAVLACGMWTGSAQTEPDDPALQLAERYAPIIGLKDQEEACDDRGEPFYPVAVDVVLGKDDVLLKRATGDSAAADEVIKSAPVAADLYARGSDYYLDLPGNPRHPGCAYEQWFDTNSDGYEPTAYAHIVADGSNRLALQYWFFYTFNNFNNTHESDWEMIQLLFDVGTVEEALQTSPVSIAAAQHGGGETAGWDDRKLQREGDRPIVYSAAGSHATQYGNAVYLGWGENGTGFGCDITTGPSTLVPLNVILLPSTEPDPTSDLAWLNFAGRWGERQPGEFNGPTGPATKSSWQGPFLWHSGLRETSIEVPIAETFGPAPADVFCSLSAAGSNLFRLIGDRPALLVSAAMAILAGMVGAVRYVWPTLVRAVSIYRRRWRLFGLIGLWLIPVGIAFNGFQYLVSNYPPGEDMISLVGKTPGSYYVLAILTLIAQHLASLIVVGPMCIEVYDEMERGHNMGFRGALRSVWQRLPVMVKAVGITVAVVVLLGVSVILIPVAIWLVVRWLFTPQAVMLDNASPREALSMSTTAVRGRWWRILISGLTLFILASVPGVLIGLWLMVFQSASVQLTNMISSLFYVVSIPITMLALTLIYRDRSLTPPLFGWLRRLGARFRTSPAEAQESGEAAPAV